MQQYILITIKIKNGGGGACIPYVKSGGQPPPAPSPPCIVEMSASLFSRLTSLSPNILLSLSLPLFFCNSHPLSAV